MPEFALPHSGMAFLQNRFFFCSAAPRRSVKSRPYLPFQASIQRYTMTSTTAPATDALHVAELSRVNQKITDGAADLPAVTLKDGSRVQTGTVATMLYNIALYNAGERGAVEEELKMAIPTLFKVGLFELFPPQQWIDGDNPGRSFVGTHARAYQNAAG